MSFPQRTTLSSHLRAGSLSQNPSSNSAASSALAARVAEKKAELASLKELQALSAAVADQMQMLEDKLSTLANGTEGMSAILECNALSDL
jgi:DASH complex subunit DAD2